MITAAVDPSGKLVCMLRRMLTYSMHVIRTYVRIAKIPVNQRRQNTDRRSAYAAIEVPVTLAENDKTLIQFVQTAYCNI